MKIAKIIRINRLQNKNKMVGRTFNTLDNNERHIRPWLGQCWFEYGMDEERKKYVEAWEKETKALIKLNPKLKLIY